MQLSAGSLLLEMYVLELTTHGAHLPGQTGQVRILF